MLGQLFVAGVVHGLIIGLAALAVTLVFGIARFPNAAAGDTMTLGAYAALAAHAASGSLLLAGLPRDEAPSGPRRDLLHDLKEGARFVAGHHLLRPILMTAVFFNISWFIFQAVYVAYAVQNLGLSATEVGITLGIYGAGMIVGAACASHVARRISFGTDGHLSVTTACRTACS